MSDAGAPRREVQGVREGALVVGRRVPSTRLGTLGRRPATFWALPVGVRATLLVLLFPVMVAAFAVVASSVVARFPLVFGCAVALMVSDEHAYQTLTRALFWPFPVYL